MIRNGKIRKLLAELKDGLKEIYGIRLKGFYLYGSYARGEQQEGSDVDVIVILDAISHYADEINQTSKFTSEISLKYDVSVSRIFFSETEWLTKDSSFLANVREEAVAA